MSRRSGDRDLRSHTGNRKILPQRVDQVSGEPEIAQLWADKYCNVFNSVNDEHDKEQFLNQINQVQDSNIDSITVNEVKTIVANLEVDKANGMDMIPNEFFKFAPDMVIIRLSLLFNAFMTHSFLPNVFTNVLLVPILKNKLKDHCSSDSYRPIAIATAASKIFERLLLNRLDGFLYSTDNQFGFKKHHSTDSCILVLKEVIRYYLRLNTPLFLCFVDIKSAFDKVSYWLLLKQLLERGVPLYLLLLLRQWFTQQQLYVRWGGAVSRGFAMANGIRQGSVLSPLLFNVYVDQFNTLLNGAKIGCHIANNPLNNFAYADDLVLVAPSAVALNELISLCEVLADRQYIKYSTTKSKAMCILPSSFSMTVLPKIRLYGENLEYVNKFNYLGHIISNDFYDDEDILKETRNLCARGNALIRQFSFCNMDVKCVLFKSFCYSFYCGALWANFRVATFKRLMVSYNMVMRRLAGVPPWHSARQMFVGLGVQSFPERVRSLCYSMRERASSSSNSLLQTLTCSDAAAGSVLWQRWTQLLDLPP